MKSKIIIGNEAKSAGALHLKIRIEWCDQLCLLQKVESSIPHCVDEK